MTSLMIADDNVQYVEHLSQLLTKEKDFIVINKSYNGMDAIMSYTTLKPDVLILDLNMPGINGIDVIDYLSKLPNENLKKNIIIHSSDVLFQNKLTKNDKIKGMISKNWDLRFLIDLIRDIKTTDSYKLLVKKTIDDLFKKLNFDECLKGTALLKDAVLIAFFNRCYSKRNIEDLITVLSNKYSDITSKTMRSLMDKSITIMYEKHDNDLNFFCKFFSNYFGFKPTTKYFIRYSIEYLQKVVNN